MPLQAHWDRVNTPMYRLTRRERWLARGMGGLIIVATVVVVLISVLGSSATKPGCIDVVSSGFIGANTQHACGKRAKDLCQSATGRHDTYSLDVISACRRGHVL